MPQRVLDMLPPRPLGFPSHRELFDSRTGLTFDPLAPAHAAALHVFQLLLNAERAARLVEQHAMESTFPGLLDVLDAATNATWKMKGRTGFDAEIARTVDIIALEQMCALAADDNALPQVREQATYHLRKLRDWLKAEAKRERNEVMLAHLSYGADVIGKLLEDPSAFKVPRQPSVPPGQPIGMDQ